MDALPRSRRLLLSVVALAWAAPACGPRPAGPAVGASHASPAFGPGKDGGAARPATSIPADFRITFTRWNHARFTSNGHAAGRFDVDIYASGVGKDALAATTGELPVGTRLVKEHFERQGGGPGPIMMMQKMERGFDPEHGDWRYVVVSSTGEEVQAGKVESCTGCHDDAPRDHVFRLPEGT